VEGVVTVVNQGPNSLSVSLQGDGGNVSVVGDVDNVDMDSGEGIYFAVRSPTVASGDAAFIDVAIVEEPNDGDSLIGGGGGGTLTIVTE
jgi:hypothetical protein